jgi:hypothetical protein
MLARNPTSLLSLIAWLKTKDPAESYPFSCTNGKCLFSQYLNQSFGQSRSIRRSGQPTSATASRMRAFDRDLIRGGHYGQRSCEPHQQAEHMAAPTKSAT